MSADGSITKLWGDAEHTFRLGLRELRELQEKRDAGAFEIYQRLANGSWRVDDIVETLRLGLVGAGVPPIKALALVGKHVRPTAFLENTIAAREVLMAALFGDPEDYVGKLLAGAATPSSQTTDAFASPASSETGQLSDLHPPKFGSVRSGNSQQPLTDGTEHTVQAMNSHAG